MAAYHPGELPDRLQSGMSCPSACLADRQEPLIKVFLGPSRIGVIPKLAKCLFEQIRAVYLEIKLLQVTQPNPLLLSEVPRILELDVASFLE